MIAGSSGCSGVWLFARFVRKVSMLAWWLVDLLMFVGFSNILSNATAVCV